MNPKVAKLVEEARRRMAERKAAEQAQQAQAQASTPPVKETVMFNSIKQFSNIEFNEQQRTAIEYALQGKSFAIIGAAGTGKTTVTQEIIALLQQCSHVSPIAADTKHLVAGSPGIVILGYTNKAVNNIRKRLPTHLQGHCLTFHKVIEFAPTYYEEIDEFGKPVTKMQFEPSRHANNPLPHISTVIIEEASMVGTDLWGQFIAALPHPKRTQFIFLGDLNQLPPVFGPSILGFKLTELPTVELTHVYRQALMSPIISLATAIRLNKTSRGVESCEWHDDPAGPRLPFKLSEPVTIDKQEHGILTLHPWKKRVENTSALHMMRHFLPRLIDSGELNPEEDMILCPFNKSFGTVELNKIIADHLAKKQGKTVFEVIARYVKSYWAVGDRVLVDRHEGFITKIVSNGGYGGKMPRPASKTLDRWGFDSEHDSPADVKSVEDIFEELDRLGGASDEESKNAASHIISVYIPDLDETRELDSAGTINSMLFGYCLTVHKSQGSEWQKVFLFLHNSHATMLSRELLYTAVTRAKHHLYVICEGDIGKYANSIKRAADRPVIPGTTLADKIAYFNSKKSAFLEQ